MNHKINIKSLNDKSLARKRVMEIVKNKLFAKVRQDEEYPSDLRQSSRRRNTKSITYNYH